MKVKTRINSAELFFVLVQTIVGAGILSLPYRSYQTAGHDGWMSVLIVGFFTQLVVLLIWLLCKRFPNHTLFDFSTLILGKPLGYIINLLYIVYLLTVVSYVFMLINDILLRWIFPETPRWVLLLIGIIFLVYSCLGTIRSMVSLFSFLFLFIPVLFFIILVTFLDPVSDVRYLFPIGSSGMEGILKGTKDIIVPFLGFETLLIYFAFMKQPKSFSAVKGAFSAVLFITMLYLYIVIITTIMFSPDEIKHAPEPVLFMLRTANINILQRLDLIFLSIWVVMVASSIISYAYLGSMGISKILGVKHKLGVTVSAIFVFFISIMFNHYVEIAFFGNWVARLSFFFAIIIPLILLVMAIIFKREASPNHEET